MGILSTDNIQNSFSVNTQVVRVTKIFNFEAAHALENYDGLCRNIHGHSYKLYVTVKGKVLKERCHAKDGMVVDFKELKVMVKKYILSVFDHSLILNNATSFKLQTEDNENIILLPFQPSSENLIGYFAAILKRNLPAHLELYSLKLAETESSFAEWFEGDQSS